MRTRQRPNNESRTSEDEANKGCIEELIHKEILNLEQKAIHLL